MIYEATLREHLPLVEKILAAASRRHRLNPEEAEELGSRIKLKLVANNYEMFRRFEGRSSLATYLSTCVSRLFVDLLREHHGRRRASAEARRLGLIAVALEELLREGRTFDEAWQNLQPRFPEVTRGEAEEIVGKLPSWNPRHDTGEAPLDKLADLNPLPDEILMARERLRLQARLRSALAAARAELPPEDRFLLRMWNEDDLKIADI